MSFTDVTPMLLPITPMDGNFPDPIFFRFTGARQIVGNEVEVRDEQNAIFYSFFQATFEHRHDFPAGFFANNRRWTARVRVRFSDESHSEWSNTVQFLTIARPVLDIVSIDNGYVYNRAVTFIATFTHPHGEQARTFRFRLFDENEDLLETFPTRIPQTPTQFEETIENLERGRQYFVDCQVETVNGFVWSHRERFIPLYINPATGGIIQTTPDTDEGFIRINAMLTKIIGTSVFGLPSDVKVTEQNKYKMRQRSLADAFNADFKFIDNEWIVIPSHKGVIFRELNMNRANDFHLRMRCRNIPDDTMFMRMTPRDGAPIHIEFWKRSNMIICRKTHGGVTANFRSNIVAIPWNANFVLNVRKIEHGIDLRLIIE